MTSADPIRLHLNGQTLPPLEPLPATSTDADVQHAARTFADEVAASHGLHAAPIARAAHAALAYRLRAARRTRGARA